MGSRSTRIRIANATGRRLRPVLLGFVASIALASSPAGAATLSLSGSMSLWIGALPPISVAASPASSSVVVSSSGAFALPPALFSTAVALPSALFTGVPLISGISITATNGTATFAPGSGPGGGFGGSGAVQGNTVIDVFGGLFSINVPLYDATAGAGVGVGGVATNGFLFWDFSVTGAPWTTGAAVVTGISTVTTGGATVSTVTLSGSDSRTAGHTGNLTLVTPIRVLSNLTGNLPGYAVMSLAFVPEPGTLALFAVGAAALWHAGRRRTTG